MAPGTYFGKSIVTRVLEGMENMEGSLRSRVDRLTNFQELKRGINNQALLKKQQSISKISAEAGADMQDHWEQAIGLLTKPKSLK